MTQPDNVREFARGIEQLATVLGEMALIERITKPVTDEQLDIAKELTRGLLNMGLAFVDGDMEKFRQLQRETVERGEKYVAEIMAMTQQASSPAAADDSAQG